MKDASGPDCGVAGSVSANDRLVVYAVCAVTNVLIAAEDDFAERSDPIRLAKTMPYAIWPDRLAHAGHWIGVAARPAAPFTAREKGLGAPR